MTDPERWLSAEDAPPGMRELIQDAQMTVPTAAQRAALSAKLGVATGGLWISPLLKAMAIGAAVAGGGILYDTLSEPEATPPQVVQTTEHSTAPVIAAESPEADVLASPPVEEVAPPEEVKAAPAPTKSAKVVAKPSEAQLLSQAKASLSSSPSRALSLLAQHEELYPSGVLSQEREVLKVKALQNAGKTKAAEAQAKEFRKDHPDSIHHLATDD